ncbi:hypothetical protein D3C75_932770 [compost metagenome]
MRKRICYIIISTEQFNGTEILNPAALHDLRQVPGIAEHIRQPQHFVVYAEFFLEEALAVHRLADQAFTAGEVRIRLNPHGAFGNDSAVLHRLFDARIQLRIQRLDQLEQIRLALRVSIFRIFVHERQLIGHGPCNLTLRLRNRPQPGYIQVGLSHKVQSRRRRTVYTG